MRDLFASATITVAADNDAKRAAGLCGLLSIFATAVSALGAAVVAVVLVLVVVVIIWPILAWVIGLIALG